MAYTVGDTNAMSSAYRKIEGLPNLIGRWLPSIAICLPSIAICLPNNDWWLPNTAKHEMVTFGGYTVEEQKSHSFVCGKHNSQMQLYVQKWESLKVYLKLLHFQGCSTAAVFTLVPIHSMSHMYIDALCSILSNFCLHFTQT